MVRERDRRVMQDEATVERRIENVASQFRNQRETLRNILRIRPAALSLNAFSRMVCAGSTRNKVQQPF